MKKQFLSRVVAVIGMIGLVLPPAFGQQNPQSDCVEDIASAGIPDELLVIRNRMFAARPGEAVGYFMSLSWSIISPEDGKELSTRTITECSGCNADPAEQFTIANEMGNLSAMHQNKKVQLFYNLNLQWNRDTGKDALAAGIVRDQHGRAVTDATIILRRMGGGEPEYTQTGSNGLFRSHVRSGEYNVTAQKRGAPESQRHLLCAYGAQRATALGQKYELPFMQFRVKGALCWEGSIHIKYEFHTIDKTPPIGYTFWDYRIEGAKITGANDSTDAISLAGSSGRTVVKTEIQQDNQVFSGVDKETSGVLEGSVDQSGNYSLSLTISEKVVQASYGIQPTPTAIGWERTIETFMFKKSPVMTGKIGLDGKMAGSYSNRFVDEDALITAGITWELVPCDQQY